MSQISPLAYAQRTRVLVADPYPVIVHGVRKMLEDDPRFEVIAEASTMPSLQKKLIAERPEVALVDWSMASQCVDVTTALLRSDLHATAIIFLTVSENSQQKEAMLRMGAQGFLSKGTSALELHTAVLNAYDGRASGEGSTSKVARTKAHRQSFEADPEQRIASLTKRELQLLPLVCSGLRNKEIALQLGIAETTVWHHLTSIFTKLNVGDRLGLAAFAYSHGLVLPQGGAGRLPVSPTAQGADSAASC